MPAHPPQPARDCTQGVACRSRAAIAAALSLAVDLVNRGAGSQFHDAAGAAAYVTEQMDFLVTRWGTAVDWQSLPSAFF
jgi:hypothetical protein